MFSLLFYAGDGAAAQHHIALIQHGSLSRGGGTLGLVKFQPETVFCGVNGGLLLGLMMPGAGGNSCLERYEYAKHGACFGFDPDAYFGTMVRLNQEIKESEAGKFLADNYGKTVSRRDFDAAFAKSWGKENVKAVKLTCQGNPAYLTEIQISIKADAINAPLSANSFLPQPHPGNCGKTFVIDKAGY